jgi:ubiquinone/menaquinone biosynthesis C-methylase UbiE
MNLYTRYILPRLLHLVMQNKALLRYRQDVVAMARGRVLEIGIGSGLNLPFYPPQVAHLYGVEPSLALLNIARQRTASVPFPVQLLQQSAEALSLAEASIDTVVMTWTLCTIPDAAAALREMRRVLKPHGRLLFAEHGLAPDARVAVWQRRLTPLWKPIAGGCHLDRPIAGMISTAGFTMTALQTTYLKGPRPWTYLYWGQATA